jgi:hypothetical protein
MGADFKEKTKKSFEKCWDKAAVEANTPALFQTPSDRAANRIEAEAIGGAEISVGDSLCIRIEEDGLIARRGVTPVLVISSPTPAVLQFIKKGCNVACADVVVADPISGIFEVAIKH